VRGVLFENCAVIQKSAALFFVERKHVYLFPENG